MADTTIQIVRFALGLFLLVGFLAVIGVSIFNIVMERR
jgi:hypothetical protein